MKKRTIRFRFFIWLALHTAIVFGAVAVSLMAYDVYEYVQHPALLEEEAEEIVVIFSVMSVLFPLNLLGAWYVSRRLLQPWRILVEQAEGISNGRLEDRLLVENPDDEVGRLSATLNQTFDRYQMLLDRMHRFGYDVSHQLRNPLAAIRTTGEISLKHPREQEEYRLAIGEILESAERLSRTVDQLLMLARAAGGGLEEFRSEIRLNKVVMDVVQEAGVIGELRGLSVEFKAPEVPVRINGVEELIREALANLLDNALKYSPDGGRISVELELVCPDTVRITVSDSGPGLPPLQKSMVFRPFEQGASSTKESIGLGLAIVADICRAHHGGFGVDDNPGGGSRFWIELHASK